MDVMGYVDITPELDRDTPNLLIGTERAESDSDDEVGL